MNTLATKNKEGKFFDKKKNKTISDEEHKSCCDDHLALLGGRLLKQAEEQVGKKSIIEQRWLEDLRQYYGQYAPDEIEKFKAAKTSQIFVNITRNKSNGAEARLSDMLHPTDDKNWGIKPTPSPEVSDLLNSEEEVELGENAVVSEAELAKSEISLAKKACEGMSKEIDDQLNETKYNSKCRDVIHHGVVLGTGILKGPVVESSVKRVWRPIKDGKAVHKLEIKEDLRPGVQVVDPWNYFPDMSAATADKAEFHYERAFWTKRDLRKMAKLPGFNKDAIREVLRSEADENKTANNLYEQLRTFSGIENVTDSSHHEGWIYYGPIEADDLVAMGKEAEDEDEDDPLKEINGIVWLVGSTVLKVIISPMESAECMFSVFNWEEDDASIFGYGVPHQMKSSQKVINSSWRMLMDNAGLCTGPQIVINRKIIAPTNGDWTLSPRKTWELTDVNKSVRDAFATHNIDSHQAELTNIFEMARQIADEETNLPLIAQGEQASHVTQTMGGMSMLMNSASIVMRRAVKSYDDNITTPTITRFYDWNMEFSEKADIKGDYQVDARGSSTLLVKEVQAQNLMTMMNFAGHPVFGPMTKGAELYRKTVNSMQLSADDVVKSDDAIKEEQEALQASQQGGDPRIAVQQEKNQLDADYKHADIALKRELGFAKLAQDEGIKLETLYQNLGIKKEEINMKRQVAGVNAANFQNELKFKHETGRQGI